MIALLDIKIEEFSGKNRAFDAESDEISPQKIHSARVWLPTRKYHEYFTFFGVLRCALPYFFLPAFLSHHQLAAVAGNHYFIYSDARSFFFCCCSSVSTISCWHFPFSSFFVKLTRTHTHTHIGSHAMELNGWVNRSRGEKTALNQFFGSNLIPLFSSFSLELFFLLLLLFYAPQKPQNFVRVRVECPLWTMRGFFFEWKKKLQFTASIKESDHVPATNRIPPLSLASSLWVVMKKYAHTTFCQWLWWRGWSVLITRMRFRWWRKERSLDDERASATLQQ